MASSQKSGSVARVVALLFCAQTVAFQWLFWRWPGVEVADRFFLGNDFAYLYNAAGFFLSGRSPYLEQNFIPLPPALYLPLALHSLSFWVALIVFRTICFVLVVVAVFWLCRSMRIDALNTALLLLVTITYAPFYSVLVGGNLDALMLALLVFSCARNRQVRGVFLGISIGTKFYSLLLLGVLALRRRWREGWLAMGVLVLLMLPFIRYAPDAVSSVVHRSSALRLVGNESPVVLFILAFGQHRRWAWGTAYAVLWIGTLVIKMRADFEARDHSDDDRFGFLEYLPWMAAAPLLVFTYTGTILIPLMVILARNNQNRRLLWSEWLTASGFVLTGLYPAVYGYFLHALQPFFAGTEGSETVGIVIAPLGISLMLLGSSLTAWKASPRKLAVALDPPEANLGEIA